LLFKLQIQLDYTVPATVVNVKNKSIDYSAETSTRNLEIIAMISNELIKDNYIYYVSMTLVTINFGKRKVHIVLTI